jgi:hypothetical protein
MFIIFNERSRNADVPMYLKMFRLDATRLGKLLKNTGA